MPHAIRKTKPTKANQLVEVYDYGKYHVRCYLNGTRRKYKGRFANPDKAQHVHGVKYIDHTRLTRMNAGVMTLGDPEHVKISNDSERRDRAPNPPPIVPLVEWPSRRQALDDVDELPTKTPDDYEREIRDLKDRISLLNKEVQAQNRTISEAEKVISSFNKLVARL